MNIYSAYNSKHNSNHEKPIILLMIQNGKGWHYLAVKTLFALLRRILSKHDCDFYHLNCLHLFQLESHKKYMKRKIIGVLQMLLKKLIYPSSINTGNLIRHHLLFKQILIL